MIAQSFSISTHPTPAKIRLLIGSVGGAQTLALPPQSLLVLLIGSVSGAQTLALPPQSLLAEQVLHRNASGDADEGLSRIFEGSAVIVHLLDDFGFERAENAKEERMRSG